MGELRPIIRKTKRPPGDGYLFFGNLKSKR